MNPMMANTSQKRNRSIGRWSARRPRLTEPMRFRNAMKPKRANKLPPNAMMKGLRSAFWQSRTRAFSSSTFVISAALLFHVPYDEDETELAQGNHEADDDIEEQENRAGRTLADEGHDRHDDDQE